MGHVDAPGGPPSGLRLETPVKGAALADHPRHLADVCPLLLQGGWRPDQPLQDACLQHHAAWGAAQDPVGLLVHLGAAPHRLHLHSDIVQSLPPVSAPGPRVTAGGRRRGAGARGWPARGAGAGAGAGGRSRWAGLGFRQCHPPARHGSLSSEPLSPSLYVGELDLVCLQTGGGKKDTSDDHWLL